MRHISEAAVAGAREKKNASMQEVSGGRSADNILVRNGDEFGKFISRLLVQWLQLVQQIFRLRTNEISLARHKMFAKGISSLSAIPLFDCSNTDRETSFGRHEKRR